MKVSVVEVEGGVADRRTEFESDCATLYDAIHKYIETVSFPKFLKFVNVAFPDFEPKLGAFQINRFGVNADGIGWLIEEDKITWRTETSDTIYTVSVPETGVPANCRQRLREEGKPYPRSSCDVCGQFAPKWQECDALLQARTSN